MTIRQLQTVALAISSTALGLAVVGILLAADDSAVLLGVAVVAVSGASAAVVIGWVRQRPIAPGDASAYKDTTVVKLAVAELPGILGFVLAVAVGPGWLALLGFAVTAAGLTLAWPSEGDRERHELLYLV